MQRQRALRKPRWSIWPVFLKGRRGHAAPLLSVLAHAAVLTVLINVLSLAGSFYLLAIYDVVLPAKSVSALAGFAIAMAGLSAICCLLEIYRGRVLSRGGAALERRLRSHVLAAVKLLPSGLHGACSPAQPVRDLEQVRMCLTGASGSLMLDLPAVPILLAAVYLQHATLGHVATGGVLLAISMAFAAHALTADHHAAVAATWTRLLRLCEGLGSRDVHARNLDKRWRDLAEVRTRLQQRAAARSAIGAAVVKAARATLQTGIVGIGAWLVLRDEISPGAMVVASILVARAVATVEAAGAQWRSVTFALASWRRLEVLLDATAQPAAPSRPPPTRQYRLARERIAVGSSSVGPVPGVRLRPDTVAGYARPMLE